MLISTCAQTEIVLLDMFKVSLELPRYSCAVLPDQPGCKIACKVFTLVAMH